MKSYLGRAGAPRNGKLTYRYHVTLVVSAPTRLYESNGGSAFVDSGTLIFQYIS